MADQNNTGKKLEDLSPEELQKKISDDKKKVRNSLILAFSAMIAIIALCIAWFVANNIVNANSSTVAADSEVPFVLASVGERQIAEQEYLKDSEGNNILSPGNEEDHTSYIDTANNEVVTKNQTYHVGSSELAWYLAGQENLYPGASGQMEFYLIPKSDGLKKATIHVDLAPYISDGGKWVVASDTEPLYKLISGHVLLFRSLSDEEGYSQWLETDMSSTASFDITLPDKQNFEKNTPYKVTIYWVWPQYLRNYIYKYRSTEGDLFTNETNENVYQSFISAVNNVNSLGGKLFFDKEENVLVQIPSDVSINADMPDEIWNTYSDYYDQADEYIGTNAKAISVEIKVN